MERSNLVAEFLLTGIMHGRRSLLLFFLVFFLTALPAPGSSAGSILFDTLGRSRYNFDIFSIPATISFSSPSSSDRRAISVAGDDELKLTDGVSVNYNGFFPSLSSSLLSSLLPSSASSSSHFDSMLYVTERNGSSSVFLDLFLPSSSSSSDGSSRRVALELTERLQFPLVPSSLYDGVAAPSMKDRPSLSGDRLVYVSTHQPNPSPRQSWAAVYSTHLRSGRTRRLTPSGIADFSPALSPSGRWTAVASSGARGWSGEVQELYTDIYVFKTDDGSRRTLLVEHGGWPSWGDESTVFFHRQSSDGWWSVYRARIAFTGATFSLLSVDRITPPGFHAFTPAASPGAPGVIVVATRRHTSTFRHIELINVEGSGASNAYVEVTRLIAPHSHHYNPFISGDASRIGYHRCRGDSNGSPSLLLENIRSIAPEAFSLFRIDGAFPSFSHDGKFIAYAGMPGLFVVNSDGSGKPREVLSDVAFQTTWDWKREGVVYTSHGPTFASVSTEVDIVSVTLPNDHRLQPVIKKLTTNGENNAFPSPSPDGKWVVFRSGRSGHKNLYIMDAVEGEKAEIQLLTQGPWTDTMANWSPDGEWIAFASDRDDPGSGSFAIYLIHPNGTGLRKLVHSGNGGRTNHPWFSPDSKSLVFTSDYAGVSAEPISNPHHYQPYGDIFIINIDGSGIQRLTHNSFEDGTPTWTPFYLKPIDVSESLQGSARCKFDDCYWLNAKALQRHVVDGIKC